VPSALTSICVVLPVTSALMVPLPLSYNRFATDCAKEVIAAEVPHNCQIMKPLEMPQTP
jgi:hypothetical protein